MPINNSNLPTNRRFKVEDYPTAQPWFATFLQALNLFVDPVYQILDGGIGYQNLVIPRIFTKTVTTPASGDVAFNFVNPLRITPSAVFIGNIYEQGNPSAHPTDAAVVYWHSSQGSIYVDNITNLTTSTTYVVTLAVL